jgi:hypothetical protein
VQRVHSRDFIPSCSLQRVPPGVPFTGAIWGVTEMGSNFVPLGGRFMRSHKEDFLHGVLLRETYGGCHSKFHTHWSYPGCPIQCKTFQGVPKKGFSSRDPIQAVPSRRYPLEGFAQEAISMRATPWGPIQGVPCRGSLPGSPLQGFPSLCLL